MKGKEETCERLTRHLESPVCLPKYEEFYGKFGVKIASLQDAEKYKKGTKESDSDTQEPWTASCPTRSLNPILKVELHMKDGTTLPVTEGDVAVGSNYGDKDGYPPLRRWLEHLQKEEHKPPQCTRPGGHPEDFSLVMVSGITEGNRCVFDVLLDKDDTVLVETELYCSVVSMLKLSCDLTTVRHDDQGMVVSHLEEILSTWHQRHPDRKFPKMLYAITAGNNPTGYTWSLPRILDIYELCRKYNVLVLEDGAYFYLQYGERLSSFQSVDVDGRVIRMDTFSKIVGGGFRMGWMSGPKSLMDKLSMAVQFITQSPNKFAQVIIYNILRSWGFEGFNNKVHEISCFYQKRAQLICKAAERHLSGLATWSVPKAGMFIWLDLKGVEDSTAVSDELLSKKISVLPGNLFIADSKKSSALRISYSIVSESDMDHSMQMVAEVLRHHVTES